MLEIINLEDVKLCSINKKYINRKYALSNEYQTFKQLIAWSVETKEVFSDNIKIKIEVNTAKDIDSMVKPLLDGLEMSGVITNDRYVTELHVIKNTIKLRQPESLKVYIC